MPSSLVTDAIDNHLCVGVSVWNSEYMKQVCRLEDSSVSQFPPTAWVPELKPGPQSRHEQFTHRATLVA